MASYLRNTDHPCRFAFIPHFVAQSFVLFKPDSFWKRTIIRLYRRETASTQHSYGDATTFTCDVIMLPVVTHAPNITNISCWKTAPKALVYTDLRILLNYYTSIASNTVLGLNGSIFHFKLSYITFINRYFTAWGITIVFPQIPLFRKNARFFHSFVGSHIGTIYHHKNFTGRVFLWGNFTSPPINLFHTQKNWQGTDPQKGLTCSKWYSQSDRRKILEPPWSVLARKRRLSHPSEGIATLSTTLFGCLTQLSLWHPAFAGI